MSFFGRALALALGSALALTQLGCAGHEDRTRTALEALDRGHPAIAIAELNDEMDVSSARELPAELQGDNALLVLDRATVQMSVGDHKSSARDLGAADKAIEVLDLSPNAAGDVGQYLFSDDVGSYRAPAYEKLLLNTINLMNYLALGDLTGAKVEARRLAVMQRYVKEHEEENDLLGIGSYLAGFAFEKAGDRDEALVFYDEALKYAQYQSLRDPLRVLTRGASRSPGIDALVGGAGPMPPVGETGEGEIVVVVGFGRVPQKVPVRIPIGLALTLVAGHLSPRDHARANELAAKGLVTWINYPTLGRGKGGYSAPSVDVDGRPVPMEEALDVEAEVRAAWKKREGTVILAAITRMLTRMVAGEVAQAATEKDGSPIGILVGLATTATLAVLDTPDTRCWSTLPSRIAVARIRVPAGRHRIRLHARGVTKVQTVDVRPGGWAFVNHMALR
jgi:hypothetical protein